MIKGLYAAASAMLVNANRQQLLSHNISNMETPGFKQILTSVEEFTQTNVIFPADDITRSNRLRAIGILGLGSMMGPEVVDYAQGALQQTGNLYDLAISGDGFFTVQTPDGTRYTRDGRFLRSPEGQLVTFEGYAVLNQGGQPITLPEGDLSVAPDGRISINGEEVAQLGLANFADPRAELERTEGNLFTATGQPTGEATPRVAQGFLEMSNANPTQLMAQLVEVGRSYEIAQQMVSNQDDLLGKTISMLGRIG